MHKKNLYAMAAVLTLLAAPVVAADSPTSVQACWKPAFEAGDARAVSMCYAHDAVLWLPGAPMMQGREAIRDGYIEFFSHYTVKSMVLVEMGRSEHGDEAASWGSYRMTVVSKADGSPTNSIGRYTDVSRKVAGSWLYVVDHASDDPTASKAN